MFVKLCEVRGIKLSHARGQVRFFYGGSIKYFEYNGTSDICRPKLYDTFDEMIDNWRKPPFSREVNNTIYTKKSWLEKIFNVSKEESLCNHNEEPIEIYADHGEGFHWKGTACKKCNMILKGMEPLELSIGDSVIDGIPGWAEDFSKYYD